MRNVFTWRLIAVPAATGGVIVAAAVAGVCASSHHEPSATSSVVTRSAGMSASGNSPRWLVPDREFKPPAGHQGVSGPPHSIALHGDGTRGKALLQRFREAAAGLSSSTSLNLLSAQPADASVGDTAIGSQVRTPFDDGTSLLVSEQQLQNQITMSAIGLDPTAEPEQDAAGNEYVTHTVDNVLVQVLLVTPDGHMYQATAFGNPEQGVQPPLTASDLLALVEGML